ncbi:unnamed protein product [Symbiodinium natans]|uniref:Chloride channel protein n=1 Tax=Symbiodinium natans TaxID=878477 RepID=A0A812V9L2_9DINO|nr:unnamed protein product [Symbiodinium natans]
MLSVTVAGVIGAGAWYWLRGRETYIVSVDESLRGAKMPPAATVMNAMVQDVVVALGGSFGREAAPREIAAMWGGMVGDAFRVSSEQRKVLVACGAGAGLAAVYSVPISGMLYTIEHMLSWDLSPSAVLPAMITSAVATLVTSTTVETRGLYSMPCYSAELPSWEIILWAAMIGPVAGLGAAAFRRFIKFVEGFKPYGRFPLEFAAANVGDNVWLTRDANGSIYREQVAVVRKADGLIFVQDRLGGQPEELDETDWEQAQAEGDRDWTILIFMPLSFVVLAVLSRTYPSLLGNGRALAEIAMKRQRQTWVLGMLLVLKALMTAAAIGAGAAGGTLTPSVSLGATLGAILGEIYQSYLPDWAPAQDPRMSVVSAAAFLAVAMNSPVTGLWLLMEFAAQGIGTEAFLAAFQGDLAKLRQSDGAVGMLIPMTIAVVCATGSVAILTRLWACIHPPPKKVEPQVESSPDSLAKYKPMPSSPMSTDLELADMITQPSLHPDEDYATLRTERSSSVNSSTPLSFSYDTLEEKSRKSARPTMRSFSSSFDLDLPQLHEQTMKRSFARARSVSDTSSVLKVLMAKAGMSDQAA